MRALAGLLVLFTFTFLPWMLWAALRTIWYRMRERQVLRAKYGDLKMFQERMEEWKLKPSAGAGREKGEARSSLAGNGLEER